MMNGQSLSAVPRSQTEDSKDDTKLSKEIQQTGGEGRTHIEVGSENGVVPVVTEVNKETEAPKTINGLSEHREEEPPAVEEVEEERGEQDERGPPEHGIQEVNRREECSRHPEDVSTCPMCICNTTGLRLVKEGVVSDKWTTSQNT